MFEWMLTSCIERANCVGVESNKLFLQGWVVVVIICLSVPLQNVLKLMSRRCPHVFEWKLAKCFQKGAVLVKDDTVHLSRE